MPLQGNSCWLCTLRTQDGRKTEESLLMVGLDCSIIIFKLSDLQLKTEGGLPAAGPHSSGVFNKFDVAN